MAPAISPVWGSSGDPARRNQPAAGAVRAALTCLPRPWPPPSLRRSVVSDGGSGDPDCVVMPGLQLAGGQQYNFFLSDADLLQFVVPMSLVQSFEVAPTAEKPAAA